MIDLNIRARELSEIYFSNDIDLLSDIDYKWNGRFSQTAGRCKFKKISGKFIPTEIEVSKKYADMFPNMVDSVLVHEMIHAVLPFEEKHGSKFLEYADKIEKMASDRGEKIKIFTHVPSDMQIPKNYKYIYKCSDCGAEYKRVRSEIDTTKYVCSKCYGKLKEQKN